MKGNGTVDKDELLWLRKWLDLNPDDEIFPVVCANGCPEGHLGKHKFSCDMATPRPQPEAD